VYHTLYKDVQYFFAPELVQHPHSSDNDEQRLCADPEGHLVLHSRLGAAEVRQNAQLVKFQKEEIPKLKIK
jgi:hypothetical protein